MSIEEQIKIARLIASGTPREVAITESRVMDKKSIVKSGPTIDVKATDMGSEMTAQDKAKSRLDKVRQAGRIARKKIQRGVSKGGAIVKSAAGKLTKKDNKLKPKSSADMNKPDDKPTTNVNVILPKDKEGVGIEKIDSAEGGATATQKAASNVAKLGAKGIKKLVGMRLRKEEFIQEVEDKKDSKTKKVIDIMRGKNSIKINPDVKENTVVVQDASGKDFVEIVDIITPQKVRSDWRKEINVTEASAAWQRKEGKSKSGGLNEKGRKSYERQNPGSDLKAPSKKVGNKRRASFCARMKGMKKKLTSAKTARDPNSRINKSLRAWNC
jgi:hypothetical protein